MRVLNSGLTWIIGEVQPVVEPLGATVCRGLVEHEHEVARVKVGWVGGVDEYVGKWGRRVAHVLRARTVTQQLRHLGVDGCTLPFLFCSAVLLVFGVDGRLIRLIIDHENREVLQIPI